MNEIKSKLSMTRYAMYVAAIILLLCGISLLLTSCSREDGGGEPPDGKEPPSRTGKLVTVNFTVSEQEYGEDGISLRNGASPKPAKGYAIPVGDDFVVYASLQESEPQVKTRALVYLPVGTKVRIVAYDASNAYVDHADYERIVPPNSTVLNAVSTELQVNDGDTYRFVAYSYNSTAALPPHYPTMLTNIANDVLWGDTTATVLGPSFSLHITLKHLFSQVFIDATLGSGAPILTPVNFTLDAGIAAYQQPVLNVQAGTFTPGTNDTVAFVKSIPLSTPTKWVSDTRLVYTNKSAPTTLKFQNLNFGVNYPGPFILNYPDSLEAGKSYTLKVAFNRISGGSADRITLDEGGNTFAITRNPNDRGLFFKFGSVVGIKNTGANFSTSDIFFSPLPGITRYGNGTSTFPDVPGLTPADWPAYTNISLDSYHNLTNVLAGRGDPCRLIGMTPNEIRGFANDDALYARETALAAILGPDAQPVGGWRMPTTEENKRFTGQTANVTYNQHWWALTSPNISPFGTPIVAGGEFPVRNSINGSLGSPGTAGNHDIAKFLPELGYLNNTGTYVSNNGYFWASELTGSSFGGSAFTFTNTTVNPVTNITDSRSHSVRCVRVDQRWSLFSVSLEDWLNGGTLGGGSTGQGDVKLW